MRTYLRAVMLLALTACPAPPQPGSACPSEDVLACGPAEQLLVCRDGFFAIFSDCRGPDGCSVDESMGCSDDGGQSRADGGETCARCDTSLNSTGDVCPPSSEGRARCDPTASAILLCTAGKLELAFRCQPPQGCVTRAGMVTCE